MNLSSFGLALSAICNPVAVLFAVVAKVVDGYCYAIEDGCVENLDYETHSRGKNWIATVVPNRAAPGGADRTFWKHGSGRWYKAPERFGAGDVVEMGGDYYTGRGRKVADRRYILVTEVSASCFVGVFMGETAPSGKRVGEYFARYFPAKPVAA